MAWQVAVELVVAVRAAGVRDAKLRDEASRASKGAVLNIAEGAARSTRGEQSRCFTIARGEAVETVAAIELATLVGDTSNEHAADVIRIGTRLYALLTGLIRR